MKKLILSFTLVLIMLMSMEVVKAEEYASGTCVYKNDFHTYTYTLTSDGTVLDSKFSYEFTKNCEGKGLGCYINSAVSGLKSENFRNSKENKIECPTILYYDYSISNTGTATGSLFANVENPAEYVFDSSKLKQILKLDTKLSVNNGKPVTKDPIISCHYGNTGLGIDLISDGKNYVKQGSSTITVVGMNTTKPTDFVGSNGKLQCPKYTIDCLSYQGTNTCSLNSPSSNTGTSGDKNDTAEDIKEKNDFINGGKYQYLLSQLKTPLSLLSASSLSYSLKIAGVDSNLNSVAYGYNLCLDKTCNGEENVAFYAERGIKDIAVYCSEVYTKYGTNKGSIPSERVDECISFDNFYNKLVTDKVINDLGSECPFITPALGEKLQFVLDIIKIAAPILALALGTFDFIKTIAAGDADKELKSSFKRFLTRVGAAVLLLVIPVILAFILDIFLENQDGYDGNNPFCNLIDFEEKS